MAEIIFFRFCKLSSYLKTSLLSE